MNILIEGDSRQEAYYELACIYAAEIQQDLETIAVAQALMRGAIAGVKIEALEEMNHNLKTADKINIG